MDEVDEHELRREAGAWAAVALANVDREFPYAVLQTVHGPGELADRPRDRTPVFFGSFDGETGLFDQAVALVAREGKASTSFIQRHLSIGYNRAAKLIEQMEKEGIVGPANHVGKREVLVRRERDDEE